MPPRPVERQCSSRSAKRCSHASEAPSFGKPALIYDLKCSGSQAYVKLARELVVRERARRAAA